MGGNEKPTGPNLGEPQLTASIPMGGMLAGQFDGEAVLIARVGENFFAVGATCTHYSAPLADGLIDGETLRCPWHHACFNLRNGAAVGAPALNDLPAYEVVVEADTVRVSGKKTPAQLASSLRHEGDCRAPATVKPQPPTE